ncbi:hypothetical protein PM082_011343 [Marasmius tenuissimus]|nr:hypothetical protein PM082_011343 [Marasmius tenuissimus]
MENLESLVWGNRLLEGIVLDCATRQNPTVATQWIRLAYHDMSTHNVDDGKGGWMLLLLLNSNGHRYELMGSMIASIRHTDNSGFLKNVGQGMTDSLNDFLPRLVPGVSLSDAMTAGVLMATISCGGLLIPFCGGRQGFTRPEMIALVACGHAFGGVRRADFPEIIPNSPETDLLLFDGTQRFDNAVVTEYLQGTTTNPLIIGPNVTTNSDLRIFSSDGNVTIKG